MNALTRGGSLVLLLIFLSPLADAQSALWPSYLVDGSPGEPDSTLDHSGQSPAGLRFWIGLELGYGFASPVCAACGEEGPQGGTTANVLLGFIFGGNLALGLQASLWVDGAGIYEKRDDKIYRTNFMAIAGYYPWDEDPWFAKVGFGFSVYNAYNRYEPARLDPAGNELPSQVHGEGGGVLVGIGYDIPLAEEFVLSPTLTYFYGSLGPLVLDNTRAIGEQSPMNLIELNLAFAFRSAE